MEFACLGAARSWGTEFSIWMQSSTRPTPNADSISQSWDHTVSFFFFYTRPSLDYKFPVLLEKISLKCLEWYGIIQWQKHHPNFKMAVVLFWCIKPVGGNSPGLICANNTRLLPQISSLKTSANISPQLKVSRPRLFLTGVLGSTRYNGNHLRCELMIICIRFIKVGRWASLV